MTPLHLDNRITQLRRTEHSPRRGEAKAFAQSLAAVAGATAEGSIPSRGLPLTGPYPTSHMSNLELRHAAESGNAWAAEVLIQRLLRKQSKLMDKASKLRRMGEGRVIPYRGGDAFYRCARAF